MKFTKATNYALHTMLALVAAFLVKQVGVQQLTNGSGPRINLSLRTVSRLEEVFGSMHIKSFFSHNNRYRESIIS